MFDLPHADIFFHSSHLYGRNIVFIVYERMSFHL